MSAQLALVMLGVLLEVAGLLLVSAEDVPWGSGVRGLVSARDRVKAAVRRRLVGPSTVEGRSSMDVGVGVSSRGDVIRRVDPTDTDDAKLACVIAEAVRTQERLNELEKRVEEEQASRVDALNELRAEENAAISETMETSRKRFIRLRRLGLVFLVWGGICLGAASLVS